MRSKIVQRCARAAAIALLGFLSMAPVCGGGGDDSPKGGGVCPAGTKSCGSGCIFASWICCDPGGGTGICDPVTASAGVTDGNCPAPAKPGDCGGSQFCCNPSGNTGSEDCAPPKHFCASSKDPATVCMDTPCCPPGREVEFGCPPPTGAPPVGSCPSIYDGVYSGEFDYTFGPTHKDSTGAVVDDPKQTTAIKATITLSCMAVANGLVILNVTHASVDEPYFGCADCAPNFGSVATLPAAPPTSAANPSASGTGLAILFPNGTSIATTNDPGSLSMSADGRSFGDVTDSTCEDGVGNSAWSSASPWPKDGAYYWCRNQTHWAMNKQ